jgi:hypothetical protein
MIVIRAGLLSARGRGAICVFLFVGSDRESR